MKKKILSIILMLAFMLSLQSSSIATNPLEDLSGNQSEEERQEEDRAIFVGYFESDRKDIFGDLSDEEINEIMMEISETLDNTDSSIERHNFVQSLDSRIRVLY